MKLVKTFRRGSGTAAQISLVRIRGQEVVLKSYPWKRTLLHSFAARLMTSRECRAYRRLRGVRGVPGFLHRRGSNGLVMEHLVGAAHPVDCEVAWRDSFFEEVKQILAAVRSRGVLHGDVCHNVLVGPRAEAYLVDFGASFTIPRLLLPLSSPLLAIGRVYDERAVLELKYRIAPDLLTVEEKEQRQQRLPFKRLVSLVQGTLQLCLQRLTARMAQTESE